MAVDFVSGVFWRFRLLWHPLFRVRENQLYQKNVSLSV